MTHTHEHFDHVGSFLRTPELKKGRLEFAEGKISEEDLVAIKHQEITKLVAKEAQIGLKSVTDGEYNRSWWHLDFLWNLNGIEAYEQENSYKFHGANTRTTNVRLCGKVTENPNHPFYEDFKFLQTVLPEGVAPKVTIPSPSLIPNRDGRSDLWEDFYPTWEAFLDDLAQTYHDTIQHFYELGARYVQLDDTTWAYLIARLIDSPEKHKFYEKQAEDIVYVVNKALAGLPEDLRISTHICRGNFRSTYLFEGSYEPVAKYLGQLNYDTFFLEYDDARSGDFSPLTDIWNSRKDVFIVLGLITSKKPELEDKVEIKAKISEAAKLVPLENLGLSTQCGFASTEEGNDLSEDEEWIKLGYIRLLTDEIWYK
ncbi:vitamin B12 independent methionine synthase [Lactovum miscens]|uniref:Methionine synthase II (Cobalamin-independent) n=1 Tax=Lactovum miscens TaxID=190387 RepID=A0A841CAX6_9LACT|nr:vitamin B12 independent methionine synthase [Lactovum miscens]MBB5888712.1 methionine synthase II (cobalamin-independent) [Lactovum miscens]